MDRIFVSCEVVAAAENCVARLAGRRIDPLALVWTWLIAARNIIRSCAFIIATSSCFAWKVHVWVHDAHVTRQGIVPAECLLLCAQVTPDLLLAFYLSEAHRQTTDLCKPINLSDTIPSQALQYLLQLRHFNLHQTPI